MRVLRLVRDGKITPEEALTLMKAAAGARDGTTRLVHEAARPEMKPLPQLAQVSQPVSYGGADWSTSTQPSSWEVNLRNTISNALRQVENAFSKALHKAQFFAGQVAELLTEQVGRLGSKLSELSKRQNATVLRYGEADGALVDVVEEYAGVFMEGNVHVAANNYTGGITIKSWEEPGYRLVVTKRAVAADEDEAKRLSQDAVQVDAGDNALTIEAETDFQIVVNMELFLPQERIYHLIAETKQGAIRAENLQCVICRAGTTNGSITMTRVSADKVDLATTNGAVVGHQVRSKHTDVSTINGHIRWTGAARTTRLAAGNGAIKVYCLPPSNRLGVDQYQLETTHGDVEIRLVEETAQAEVHLAAATSFGSLAAPADSRIVQRHDAIGAQRLVAELPGDAHQRLDIDAKTRYGTVTLHR